MLLAQKNNNIEWIHVVYDRNRWWALVNTIMNLRDPKKENNLLSI
jgi:hypothetical protein